MKQIPLTQGQFAIVDNADFEWLNRYKWWVSKGYVGYYAKRVKVKNGKRQTIFMHRQILGLICGDRRYTDHRNHNGLDNRRCNLRICDNRQNQANRQIYTKKISKYKGVYRRNKKWRAGIKNNGKDYHLGYFDTETEAAKAYDKEAKKLFGDFANTNF